VAEGVEEMIGAAMTDALFPVPGLHVHDAGDDFKNKSGELRLQRGVTLSVSARSLNALATIHDASPARRGFSLFV